VSARRRELARSRADLDGTLHVLRDNLGRADAMVCATEHQIERYTWRAEGEGDEEDEGGDRRLDHMVHLLAAAKESVRAAVYASGQLADELARNRRGA
jgi:hypothetical protein